MEIIGINYLEQQRNGTITVQDGANTIEFRATDHAGNVSATVQKLVNVDLANPELIITTAL